VPATLPRHSVSRGEGPGALSTHLSLGTLESTEPAAMARSIVAEGLSIAAHPLAR
jgi:hypothetical protein